MPAPAWGLREWLAFAGIALGVASAPLDSAVNVAFPAIDTAFAVGIGAIHWVVICYVLTYASLLLGLGRLGDVAGHRAVFLAGIGISLVGLTACALAASFELFLGARAVQGVGSALLLATGPALTTLSAPASERTRVLALYMLAFGVANGAGPLLGGSLVQAFGWASVFWFRIPVLLLAGMLALFCIPRRPVAHAERFDLRAAVLVAVAVASALLFFVFATRQGLDATTLALLVICALATALFVALERGASAARLIDTRHFADRRFTATNLAHILVNAASFAVMLIVPFYLARHLGDNVTAAGFLLAMHPIGMALAPLPGRVLVERFGHYTASLLGIAAVAVGLLCVSRWPAAAPWPAIAATLLLGGVGHGVFQLSALDLVMAVLGRRQQGVGGSLNMLTRTIGVVSAASAGTLLFTAARRGSFEDGFQQVFEVAGVVAIAGFVLLAALGRPNTTRS